MLWDAKKTQNVECLQIKKFDATKLFKRSIVCVVYAVCITANLLRLKSNFILKFDQQNSLFRSLVILTVIQSRDENSFHRSLTYLLNGCNKKIKKKEREAACRKCTIRMVY